VGFMAGCGKNMTLDGRVFFDWPVSFNASCLPRTFEATVEIPLASICIMRYGSSGCQSSPNCPSCPTSINIILPMLRRDTSGQT
jgi:hypothetical protein